MGNTFRTRQDGSNNHGKKSLPRGTTKCQRDDSLTIALIYGSEGDPQNLGGNSGLPQHQSLPELSSGLPGIVPLPRITFAQMTQSNDAINDIFISISPLFTVSAPAVMVAMISETSIQSNISRQTCVGHKCHISCNHFFRRPLRISFIRKMLNEACCHGWHGHTILL